ncbi:MAG: MiaB/RimO family radical SAM methylthiotransferase, partial [Crocinitomicaceae bacterium]|nr:MiaB/RimO family radical SAM methylthiotransferase [Crocinitomicaceae bacterium]
ERLQTTPKHYAYLKIAEGCNRPCSFCAIPLMRGNHVSKSIEFLVQEAKNLVKNGTKEIMLIAQDLTYYGLDNYGERKLADLLRNLSDIKGLEWIRLHYAYPSQFPMDAIKVMAERSNICKYLDMPIQHISDNMLKAMRRGITRRRTIEVINEIRQMVPEIALRTTMLVGHPGETEEDIVDLLNALDEIKFQRLGVFTYSHEDNTHAFTMEDIIPQDEKQERANRVMEKQMDISWAYNQSLVGTTQKVLFDRLENDHFVGRTQFDSPEVDNEVWVSVDGNYVRMGDFANVLITEATHYDLNGKLV